MRFTAADVPGILTSVRERVYKRVGGKSFAETLSHYPAWEATIFKRKKNNLHVANNEEEVLGLSTGELWTTSTTVTS